MKISEIPDSLQQARTEDLTEEEIVRYKCLDRSEHKVIELLKGAGCHLLEGSRGVGKSMLMRLAEIDLDKTFNRDKVLSVYVSFKTSMLLENDQYNNQFYSFRIWIMAKILKAFTEKLQLFGVIEDYKTLQPYKTLFNITNVEDLGSSLDEKIAILQKLVLTADNNERKNLESKIGNNFAETFNDVEFVTETIKNTIKHIKVNRVVFLFDEAAHAFVPEQQKIFFDMVKLLHGSEICVKVAVYPGITNYGGNFEYGHDATPIQLERVDMFSATSRKDNIKFFRNLLQKRLQDSPALNKHFFSKGDVLDLIICLSNGNPRAFLHIISKFVQNDEYSIRSAILMSGEYVDTELVKYHKDLKNRLPKLSSVIDLGLSLLRNYIVPEIQKKNEGKKHAINKKQSVFFTLEKECPYKIHRALELLCYSGMISKIGLVKIAQRKTAPRYSINLGLAVQERIFAKEYSRQPMSAINILSKDDYREFYMNDSVFEEYISSHKDNLAPCQKCGRERENIEHSGCPYCMNPYPKSNILPTLMGDDINNLSLPPIIGRALKTDGRYVIVKNIYTSSLEELQSVYLIGKIRSRIVRNVVEEYLS
ncbi:ORC-CDC6 family AAA ATPase [Paenibacillus graminis]|uniref:ORC-CDC6 family AAA ATPase n=1 Tax=Paenibacillus graminis TaxID=189425 RepID=UPI002DBEE4EC|nr:hypothetical protein [Paenibacillus graminis]MEC0167390.1 hypothetical protein [Paenibacillus graminis]